MTPVAPRAPVDVRSVPEDPLARLAFSDRAHGNVSLIVGEGRPQARVAVVEALGVPSHHGVFMQQVHGAGVARVDRTHRGRGVDDHGAAIGQVDALVTFDPGVALAVLAADCVPVLLVDPGRGIGAVHAGRAGVRAGVIGKAVDALTGGRAGSVVAVIGPAIGGCCYEVPAELAADVAGIVPAARATTRAGAPSLDLPAAVAAQLADAGVGRVEQRPGCTRCSPGRWFSHRASSSEGWAEGRQAGAVVRLPAVAVAAAGSSGTGTLHSRSR